MEASLRPYPYQTEGVEFLSSTPSALLCDAPGLGKTMQAILAAEQRGACRILAVCPNVVKWQWAAEVHKWTQCSSYVCGQGSEGVNEWLWALEDVDCPAYYIIHWSALRLLPDSFFRIKWDVLIADEIHHACNRKAQRTKSLKRIRADYKWGLGATPYRNWIADLWSILNWLDRKSWRSYWRFYNKYMVYVETGWGRQVLGERNLDQLADALRSVVLRREKDEVAKWLPPLTRTVVPVELTREQRTEYEERRKSLRITLEDGATQFILNPLQRTTLLRQATSTARLQAACDLLDTLEGKVIAFTYFRDEAEDLTAGLAMAGREVYCIMGGMGDAIRDAQLKLFLSAPTGSDAVQVATLGVGGVGLDLDVADTAVFAGLSWSSVEMSQALERIHRVTSTRPKHAYYVVAKDTIDEVVLWAAEAKADRQAFALAAIRHIQEGGDTSV